VRITNNNNLPLPIYEAIIANPYSRGKADISVTDMIDPPRLVALRELHSEDLASDASDLVWSLMGQVMHTILERSGIKSGKGEAETRLYKTIEFDDGSKPWVLSGQFDYLDEDGVLWDWKFVSTYEYTSGVKGSRVQQLNTYALLAQNSGGPAVSGIRVGFVFRDWSQRTAQRDSSYPQSQAVEFSLPLWDRFETEAFVKDRVLLHKDAREALAKGEEPVECTPEERWEKPAVYAVHKGKNKRADRLFSSAEQANDYAELSGANTGNSFSVQYRPGESTRCKFYCPVVKWCNQGQQYL